MYFSTESFVEKPALVGQPTKNGFYLIGGGLFGDKKARAILLNWDFLSKESLSTNLPGTNKKYLQIN
ncbi:MAG: hypothetical protein RLN82_04770 [Pseudomonadales bacterium]